jgi:DNA-binding response OmpR family regulator
MTTSILIASPHVKELTSFIATLSDTPDVTVLQAHSRPETLELIRQTKPPLAIIDARLDGDHGVRLSRDILMINAMTTIAILDDAPDADFNEVTEGLGVLMQLPLVCGPQQAEIVWSRYLQLL